MSIAVSKIISNANTELQINGQRVSQVDMLVYINKAIKYFYKNYQMPMAEKMSDLLLFTGVDEYPVPSDFAGLIDPRRPFSLYSPRFEQTKSNDFYLHPENGRTAIKFIQDRQVLLVNYQEGDWIRIHNCDSLTDDGTWSIAGDSAAVAVDDQYYSEGEGSLKFTIAASGGTTTLTNTGFSTLDLSSYLTSGYIFLDLYNPNTVAMPSITLRIGSDASNYYEIASVSTRHRGDTILGGWGLVSFNMSSKTTTGTPDDDAIDYIAIILNNGVSATVDGTYRLDNIFLSEGVYFQLPYYSKYLVKNGSTYKETVTATDDDLLVPFDIEEAIEYKTLEQAAVYSLKDQALASYFVRELTECENTLATHYPSLRSVPQMQWYKNAGKF